MEKITISTKPSNCIQRLIPVRVVFALLSFMAFTLVYAYKVVLSMSIVSMVNSAQTSGQNQSNLFYNKSEPIYDNGQCPHPVEHPYSNGTRPTTIGEFDWNEQEKSNVLGAYFIGYIILQFPAGILASRFGAKWIFGTSMLIAALLSLASPWAARYHYRMFMAVRIVQGLAQGVAFPSMNVMIATWIPEMERSRGTAVIHSGAMIGTVATLSITSMLSNSTLMGGWPSVYYILGIIGVVWYILWTLLVYESPDLHPYISDKERNYIERNGGGMQKDKKYFVPYREIFCSIPFYAIVLCHFTSNWAFLTILTFMPTYLKEVLHVTETQKSIIAPIPYLGQAVFSWIVSWISDKCRKSGILTVTTIRRGNTFIAIAPGAILMLIIPLAGCSIIYSCLIFILIITIYGAHSSGVTSCYVDMAPEYSGVLMGIANGVGNIPGFMTPLVASQFTKHGHTVQNWSYVFYISSAIYMSGALIFVFFGSGQEQPWGRRKRIRNSSSPSRTPETIRYGSIELSHEMMEKNEKICVL